MLKLNRESYMDKLRACWIGKNIGGTIGTPFEGKQELLDVREFAGNGGEPLPNDDLDLQLVWLAAMERVGPGRLNCNTLADFWLDWIPPHWNEYGIAKTNLRLGLLPPMSGELDNEKWKTSNGAWIRSEIWAAFAPGVPDVAIRYAMADAMVDHGMGEGTYAEVFTATLQSMAYVESDIRKLLEFALKKIPADCMVAKTVRLVMDCYDKGIDYRQTREEVVAFNRELGWFQAPGNLGFVTIGLLYGEGDFKKSVLYALNCGDDTDCTAATVGATLGILGGMAGIPADWAAMVGDRIVTVSISGMYQRHIPKTCTELARRIAALLPAVMKEHRVKWILTEEETDYSSHYFERYNTSNPETLFTISPYSYEVTHYDAFRVRVELEDSPRVRPGDSRQVTLTFLCNPKQEESRKLQLKLWLPEGWQAGYYQKTVSLAYPQPLHGLYGDAKVSFTLTVGERLDAVNRAYMEVTCPTLSYPVMVPIVLMG